jgi:hypothetical protein
MLQAELSDLKKRVYVAMRLHPERQRFTLPPKPGQLKGEVLKDGVKLAAMGLGNGSEVILKDLGPQVRFSAALTTQRQQATAAVAGRRCCPCCLCAAPPCASHKVA